MCSNTTKFVWYDLYNIAKHIPLHIVPSTKFVLNQKFKKNIWQISRGDSRAPLLRSLELGGLKRKEPKF